jgi:hypothetical protein
MDKKDELKSLLDIYNILKKDESEYNLYKDSKILTKLIKKTEEQLKELENE